MPNSTVGLLLEECGYSNLNDSYEEMKLRPDHMGYNFPYLYGGDDKFAFTEAISAEWNGALPFTLLVEPGGKVVWSYQGPVDFLELRRAIVERTASVAEAQLVAPCLRFRNDAERIDSIGGHFDRHTGTLHHHKSLGLPILLGPDDYIPGTALWLTRQAFEQLGGTDERYVMYWEDVDFSFRAHRAGIRQARCEAALIRHGIGQTCHKKPIYSTYYFQRNRIRFCQTWLSSEEWAPVSQRIQSDLETLLQRVQQRGDTVRESYLTQLLAMLSAGEMPA